MTGETSNNLKDLKIAVLIPCYNEAITIESVIRDFNTTLPYADIYVGDNNSTDHTAQIALNTHRCKVIACTKQGKGAALRTMLDTLTIKNYYDYYILVDGDATYNSKHVISMLELLEDKSKNFEMITGDRLTKSYNGQKISHNFGNHLVDKLINIKYHTKSVKDAMSGLRIFSRNIAENFVKESKYNGFEVEVELVMWCLKNNIKIRSIGCDYNLRPEGSKSKLNTIKDGFKILRAIVFSKK